MKKLLVLIAFLGQGALAQELGILGGFHQTTADAKNAGVSTDGKIGFKLGGIARFEMANQFSFRSGLLYTTRYFELTALGLDAEANFSYLDVPALVDYRFNEMVSLYGGLTIGINVSDDAKSNGVNTTPPGMEDMIPLAQVGASFLFQDMFSLDVYYERGFGDIYDGAKDYSTFGANFIYWIY